MNNRSYRKSRKIYIRNVTHFANTIEEEFNQRLTYLLKREKGLDLEDPKNRPMFATGAVFSWCFGFGLDQRFCNQLPPHVPLQLAAHIFLLLTKKYVFVSTDYPILVSSLPWLIEATITQDTMNEVIRNKNLLDSTPESMSRFMTTLA
jgi:hypothetical protein